MRADEIPLTQQLGPASRPDGDPSHKRPVKNEKPEERAPTEIFATRIPMSTVEGYSLRQDVARQPHRDIALESAAESRVRIEQAHSARPFEPDHTTRSPLPTFPLQIPHDDHPTRAG
jgi:hypothetical protein